MSSAYNNINVTLTGNIAEIVLNNPPVNIMTREMIVEINSVLEDLIKGNNLHLLVLKAAGKHFSTGADVGEHTKEKCREMIPEFMKLFFNLDRISCPSVAIVQGMALGGGCEFSTYCDMVIASENAKFGQPEIAVGVFPPVAAVIFPHLVGRNRALELLMTGEIISADEAERIGLINKVFSEERFSEQVGEFLSKLKDKSPVVLKILKRTVDWGLYTHVNQAMEIAEKIYLQQLMETDDANEGIQAFLEKRKPVWKGK